MENMRIHGSVIEIGRVPPRPGRDARPPEGRPGGAAGHRRVACDDAAHARVRRANGARAITFDAADYPGVHPLLTPFVLKIALQWFIVYSTFMRGIDDLDDARIHGPAGAGRRRGDMAVSVACIGDNCIDRYLGGVQVAQVGGCAVNVAVGLARSGFETAYFGAVGDEQDGATVLTALASPESTPRQSRCARSRPPSPWSSSVPTATGCSRRSTSAPAGSTGRRQTRWRGWTRAHGCTAWAWRPGGAARSLEHARVSYDFSDTSEPISDRCTGTAARPGLHLGRRRRPRNRARPRRGSASQPGPKRQL